MTDIQYYMEEQTVLAKLSRICLKDTKEMPCADQDTVVDIVPQVEHVLTDNRVLSTHLQICQVVRLMIERIEGPEAFDLKEVHQQAH